MINLKSFFISLIFLVQLCGFSMAQNKGYGSIKLRVTKEGKELLKSTAITLRCRNKKTHIQFSDSFTIQNGTQKGQTKLPNGTYSVKIFSDKYIDILITDVIINTNKTSTIKVELIHHTELPNEKILRFKFKEVK